MSSDWQKDDEAQDEGGLRRHDIGMIGMVVGLSILWAVGAAFFEWHFESEEGRYGRTFVGWVLVVGER
jgi:hypothetical protein